MSDDFFSFSLEPKNNMVPVGEGQDYVMFTREKDKKGRTLITATHVSYSAGILVSGSNWSFTEREWDAIERKRRET